MSIEKTGTIQAFGNTQAGKPKVQIGGQWYFLGRTDMSTAKIGDAISFEANAFGDKGNLWGINKWGKLPASTNGVHAVAPAAPVSRAVASLDMSEGERLCVSNWIGQAIGAGTIKDPLDLEKWVSASRHALKAQTREPGSDDDFG